MFFVILLQQYTVSSQNMSLPISLPFCKIKELAPFKDTIDKIQYVLSKTTAGKITLQLYRHQTHHNLP